MMFSNNNKLVKRVMHMKGRRTFQQPCQFHDSNRLELHEVGDKALGHDYIIRPQNDKAIQCGVTLALSTCNTDNIVYASKAVVHVEGGWPKDVSAGDAEQVARHRKKIERDDNYAKQTIELCKKLENIILQNNAINIYQNYFKDLDPLPIAEKCSAKTPNTFKDPSGEKRPLGHISWAPEHRPHVVACYCVKNFSQAQPETTDAYIWDINNPNVPHQTISASSAPNCMKYNVKDFHLLVGGLFSGQVALWDPRTGAKPVCYTDRCFSHRSCVNSIQWLSSKSNTEFFSGASDGQVLTWDSRKMAAEPIEALLMDPHRCEEPALEQAFGITVLEFEQTIPARFMVGTDQGVCFSCNRKGKSPLDKIPLRTLCHAGPIYSLERNPAFVKIYLTVGDWQAKVWSEECKESAIIWTRAYRDKPLAGTWSKTRFSLFFICRTTGIFEGWDLLRDQHEPVLSMKLCDQPLISVTSHECGNFVSVGSADGTMYLVEVSENMVGLLRNDKSMFTSILERETRREKIIEGKLKEMKLKAKTALEEIAMKKLKQDRLRRIEEEKKLEEANKGVGDPESDEDDPETKAHKDFYLAISQERERRANEADLKQIF